MLTQQQQLALIGLIRALAFTALLGLLFFVLTSCSKPAPQITTGLNLPSQSVSLALPGAFLPDVGYSQVNSAWLRRYYDDFRDDLSRRDIPHGNARFDCNKFAAAYAVGAQMRFYRDMFHSWNPAQALAVGEIWYQSARGPHAINCAFTERGLLFIEPQTGQEVALTLQEKASIYYVRF